MIFRYFHVGTVGSEVTSAAAFASFDLCVECLPGHERLWDFPTPGYHSAGVQEGVHKGVQTGVQMGLQEGVQEVPSGRPGFSIMSLISPFLPVARLLRLSRLSCPSKKYRGARHPCRVSIGLRGPRAPGWVGRISESPSVCPSLRPGPLVQAAGRGPSYWGPSGGSSPGAPGRSAFSSGLSHHPREGEGQAKTAMPRSRDAGVGRGLAADKSKKIV